MICQWWDSITPHTWVPSPNRKVRRYQQKGTWLEKDNNDKQRLIAKKAMKFYSQWEGNKIRMDPLICEIELCSKSLKDEKLDSTRPRHDPQQLSKEANSTPRMAGSSDERAAESWDLPRVVDWRSDGPDYVGLQKGTIPFNYQLITCHFTTWKLLSGSIAARMSVYVAQCMSMAQKGVLSYTRGARHLLLMDRAVSRDCKTSKNNLSTAWNDYKEA